MREIEIQRSTIGEVCQIIDCEHKTAPTVENSDFYVIKTNSVKDGQLILSELQPTSKEAFKQWTKRAVPAHGDIVFTREAPAGESCLIPKDKKVCLGQRTVLLRLKNKKIHYEYLAQYLSSPKCLAYIKRLSLGTTVSRINIADIKNIKVSFPEETTQIAEVKTLSAVDKKITLLKEKHALLQQYKKGVMQKLFKQEIRFKDDNGNAFPDWQEKSMGQVLIPETREIPKPSEKYLALGIRSHMKGTFQKPDSDPNNIAMEKLYVVRPNDLVINITFAWEGAIAIARQEDDGGLVSHRFPTYLFKKGQATHRYFKHIIQLKRFKYLLDLISPGGAGRNRVLSKSEFLKLKWELPSIVEQEKIADFLDALDNKIDAVSKQIELTQTFKKGLLQQMFV